MDVKTRVSLAPYAGFCYGVERAVEQTKKALLGRGCAFCNHGIVHNDEVMTELLQLGLQQFEDPASGAGKLFVVSAHGVSRSVCANVRRLGCEILDLTCPTVVSLQKTAVSLAETGHQVILFGQRAHPEVLGVLGQTDEAITVIENSVEARTCDLREGAILISQTTKRREEFREVLSVLRERDPGVETRNTICPSTEMRVDAAKEVASRVDFMVVVGSRESSNTMELLHAVEQIRPALLVQNAKQLPLRSFSGFCHIGVTAGASTSKAVIDQVVEAIENT